MFKRYFGPMTPLELMDSNKLPKIYTAIPTVHFIKSVERQYVDKWANSVPHSELVPWMMAAREKEELYKITELGDPIL